MPTSVLMPQMGESIAEGTIVRWLRKVGDRVERDEPLFEISTDKVDAEIPSPAAGVLAEIRAKEGETVEVNSVVAVIGESAGETAQAPSGGQAGASTPAPGVNASQPAPPTPAPPPAAAAAEVKPPTSAAVAPPPPAPAQAKPAPTPPAPTPSAQERPAPAPPAAGSVQAPASAPARTAEERPASRDELRRQRSSPLVRKIAAEHGVEIGQIPGSGIGGRVTKHDILEYIDRGTPAQAGPAEPAQLQAAPRAAAAPPQAAAVHAPAPPGEPAAIPPAWGVKPGAQDEVVPMTTMRRRIAEHMIASRRTSAHVHSVFEVDFSQVERIRAARKADYERAGTKLTYLPFIVKAVVDGLRDVPVVNASVDGENIVYHKAINIGIAVALDWGLIVPVVKRADELNILGLGRTMADLASRARNKQLKPEEVQGATFTITNPGVFGALFGMPIISQPQVAILGVGAVEKRVVVVGDAIAVRPRAFLSLGYDHRVIDGAVADAFMSIVKKRIENFDAAGL